jgi:hypothetical protein
MTTTTTRETLRSFANRIALRIESRLVDRNPNISDMPEGSNHFLVTLRCRISGKARRLTTYFSMGPALSHEPTGEEVIECLLSDAAGVANARSFEDWCSDYGYDSDSRKAERIYNACAGHAAKLENFLGAEYQHAVNKLDFS